MSASGQTGPPGTPPDRLRTHAIELYCRELCGADRMTAAADHVIRSISPADADGGDDQLLRVTRTAAAAHAPRKASPRGLRGMLAAEHQSECDLSPALLAERANGELSPARQFKLENHLARCLFCRAAELRERRASRAFSAVLATGDPASRRIRAPAEPPPQPTQIMTPLTEAQAAPEPPPTTELPAVTEIPPPTSHERRGLAVFPAGPRAPAAAPPPDRPVAARPAAAVAAYAPFLITLALGAVIVVVVALALGGGAGARPSAASLPPPAPSSTPPAAVGIGVGRSAPKPVPAAKPSAQPVIPSTTTTSSTSAPSQPNAAAPASGAAPVASVPPASSGNNTAGASPAERDSSGGGGSGSAGSSGSSGSQSVAPGQPVPGLPTQNLPSPPVGGGTP